MKKLMLVALLLSLTGSAFAEINCTEEIKSKALDLASNEGYFDCGVGEPESTSTDSLDPSGTVTLFCSHHISPMSVDRGMVTYYFSGAADQDCSNVSVRANEFGDANAN